MSHDHDHDHEPISPLAVRTEALEDLLVEKGLLKRAEIDAMVDAYEHNTGPLNGARLVARAWTDGHFRERLLTDGGAAMKELGLTGLECDRLEVVENTSEVHNVVVCTLCSCYPWAVLGLPPTWYKQPAYRSQVVRQPRQLLAEMGLEVAAGTEIRVWDSSAEVRYMVLPMRPVGTEQLDEDQLTTLVSRDAMIGVAVVEAPDSAHQ